MRTLPTTWDGFKFIDGYPGKYVVIARRKGDNWYIAGIIAESIERTVILNIPFISKNLNGFIITDYASNKEEFIKADVNLSKPLKVKMNLNGGFVIKTLQK